MQFVYITCRDEKEAIEMGQKLLEKKLAACVNIFPGMKSMYRSKGKIEKGTEVVLLCKTTDTRVMELGDEVRKMHSYEVPAIVAVKADGGDERYIEWMEGEIE